LIAKYKYVLIIGAGGSKPYGFPLGLDLYKNIRNNYVSQLDNYFANDNHGFINPDQIISDANRFIAEMKKTIGVSIDKYLNINKCFLKHGIDAIVSEIYLSECKSELPLNGNEPEGDWYTYLYQKLIQGLNTADELSNFSDNQVSFITFNYDRSLEYFLFENLYGLVKNAGMTKKDLAEKFLKIPFIHVYGKIGSLPWQTGVYGDDLTIIDKNKKIVSYGNDIGKKNHPIKVSMSVNDMIKIMYDERKQEDELKTARKLIEEADRVLFLGFGYDESNLKILDMPNLLNGKSVYGTAFKCTKNEIIHIKNLLGLRNNPKSEIYDFDCLTLLREHLV
jgi:hypothetical protein